MWLVIEGIYIVQLLLYSCAFLAFSYAYVECNVVECDARVFTLHNSTFDISIRESQKRTRIQQLNNISLREPTTSIPQHATQYDSGTLRCTDPWRLNRQEIHRHIYMNCKALCWRVQVQNDNAFPFVNAAFQLHWRTTRDTSFLWNVKNTCLCFKSSWRFLFQYFVSQLNCLCLTKLVSAPVWYPPSDSSSCAELHLQQSIVSDVSTADNVYLWTTTDQTS
jgi:hypothetical protein